MIGYDYAMADDNKADLLLDKADSLYNAQQYKPALEAGLQALPLCKGTEGEADCLNLLGMIYVRMGDVKNAAYYAKQCLEKD